MIAEYSVNYKNKTKDELIMLLNEANALIGKLQNELDNSISKDKIKKDLETCEKVYEKEMKPYQRDYGLDVSLLNKKQKENLINTRNCLIAQMETYKQLLGIGRYKK